MAILILRPKREWPAYLVAVGVAELSMDLANGVSAATAVGWALANTCEPLLGASLVRRAGRGVPDLSRVSGIALFAATAVMAAPLTGAAIGAISGLLFEGTPFLPRFPRWYIGDAIGVLVVAPALLVLSKRAARTDVLRGSAELLGLALFALVTLGPWRLSAQAGFPFLVLPIMAAVGVRLRTPGAVVAILSVGVIVEVVTAVGEGPFGTSGALDGLVTAQMFLVMSALTTLIVAALRSDLMTRDEIESRLREQALHDPLTGLANRRLLFDRLAVASRRLARQPSRIALLYIDVDRFKTVNDEYGHAAGDAMLCELARRLTDNVRGGDTVARIGGDEFAVVATDIEDERVGRLLASRIELALAAPITWKSRTISRPVSVGLAVADSPVPDLDEFLKLADDRMYEVKHAPRTHAKQGRPPSPAYSSA